MVMEDYKMLYEQEVKEKILNYNKLVLKYTKLLFLYNSHINSSLSNNMDFLKKTIVGFNYYQQEYIGNIDIPKNCSLELLNLWLNIFTKDELTDFDTLFLISINIVSNLKNISPVENQNICESIMLNLCNIYATLKRKKIKN